MKKIELLAPAGGRAAMIYSLLWRTEQTPYI